MNYSLNFQIAPMIRLNGRPIVALSQLGNGGILKETERDWEEVQG